DPPGRWNGPRNRTSGRYWDRFGEDVQAAFELIVGRRQRRQQPDYVAVEAAREEQQSLLTSLGRDRLRDVARTLDELDSPHRPEAPGVADRVLPVGDLLEAAAKDAADGLGALAEAGLDERLENGARGRAGDRVAAERTAEAAGMHRVHDGGTA